MHFLHQQKNVIILIFFNKFSQAQKVKSNHFLISVLIFFSKNPEVLYNFQEKFVLSLNNLSQFCLLTHNRSNNIASCKSRGDVNIKKSEALEVLIIKIQCDIRWNQHIFQCLSFLRRSKIFLLFKQLISKREQNTTLVCGAVPKHLF